MNHFLNALPILIPEIIAVIAIISNNIIKEKSIILDVVAIIFILFGLLANFYKHHQLLRFKEATEVDKTIPFIKSVFVVQINTKNINSNDKVYSDKLINNILKYQGSNGKIGEIRLNSHGVIDFSADLVQCNKMLVVNERVKGSENVKKYFASGFEYENITDTEACSDVKDNSKSDTYPPNQKFIYEEIIYTSSYVISIDSNELAGKVISRIQQTPKISEITLKNIHPDNKYKNYLKENLKA